MSGLEATLKAKEAEASALRSRLPAGDAAPGVVLVVNGDDPASRQLRQAPAVRPHKVTATCGATAHSAESFPCLTALQTIVGGAPASFCLPRAARQAAYFCIGACSSLISGNLQG